MLAAAAGVPPLGMAPPPQQHHGHRHLHNHGHPAGVLSPGGMPPMSMMGGALLGMPMASGVGQTLMGIGGMGQDGRERGAGGAGVRGMMSPLDHMYSSQPAYTLPHYAPMGQMGQMMGGQHFFSNGVQHPN